MVVARVGGVLVMVMGGLVASVRSVVSVIPVVVAAIVVAVVIISVISVVIGRALVVGSSSCMPRWKGSPGCWTFR